jgi:hypothetical protein
MNDKRPPITKSAAFRFGLTFCPSCNPNDLPSTDIAESLACAWCWNEQGKFHVRYVDKPTLRRWRKEHGLPEDDEDDIPTSPESRHALRQPISPTANTVPAPFKPPIKREEDD